MCCGTEIKITKVTGNSDVILRIIIYEQGVRKLLNHSGNDRGTQYTRESDTRC